MSDCDLTLPISRYGGRYGIDFDWRDLELIPLIPIWHKCPVESFVLAVGNRTMPRRRGVYSDMPDPVATRAAMREADEEFAWLG